MSRTTFGAVALTMLLAITTANARPTILAQPFAGIRFGSNFGEGYYENELLQELDIAPGAEFGFVIDVPVWAAGVGQEWMAELTYNYQSSDLRFEPSSMDNVPPQFRDRFEVDGDKLILGEIHVSYIHIGGLYQFGDYSGWLPYVNGGIGATIFDAADGDVDSDSQFSAFVGGGVSRMFADHIGARLQLRGHLTSLPAEEAYWIDPWGGVWAVTDDNTLFQADLSLGVVFAF